MVTVDHLFYLIHYVNLFEDLIVSLFRGVGYPALWPSKDCQQPLDVSNEFTFQVIDGILSGNITSSIKIL